jgi:AraC-like DNA-binding protein
VDDPVETNQPSYAARMLRPYARLLRHYPQIDSQFLVRLDALEPDARVPIAPMLELLRGAVHLTGDEDLGLKAAREIVQGEYGAIEFMVNSAGNMRESIELLGRYLPLVNDALSFELRVEGERAIVQLDSSVVLPRAAADFQSAAFYVATLQRGHAIDPDYEAWFKHPAPQDTSEYQRTFAPGKLRFGAPFNGFVFSESLLQQPTAAPDPKLHEVLRKYADVLISELPKSESVSDRVRAQIRDKLANRGSSVTRVARALAMSRRTLARKLEQEGTTFSQLLEETRHQLALRYVKSRALEITEIAFLLGFSQTGPFHRAFKRWTGQTPREYRRGIRA